MVLKNVQLESAKRHQCIWNKNKDIETRHISRTTQSTLNSKRIVLDNHDTLPFGYEE